jgi:oligoendopeptidase F
MLPGVAAAFRGQQHMPYAKQNFDLVIRSPSTGVFHYNDFTGTENNTHESQKGKQIMTTNQVLQRQDVPQESKWHSEALFASWEEWETEAAEMESLLPHLSAFQGALTQEPSLLADWLTLVNALDRRLMRLFVYAFFANAVDANDMAAKEHMGQISALYTRFKAASAFAEPAMLQLGEGLLAWAKEEPRLALYKHYFADLLRQRAHRRSAEVEEILSMVQEPFRQAVHTASELTDLEMKFADALDSRGQNHPVIQTTIPSTLQSPDRELRRTAWENYCDGYLSFKNTLASSYLASVKQNLFLARVRGYDSVLEARLKPANMPLEVFHNLIDAFKDNISTWHRYWAVKRRALGVEALHPYDIWAPIVMSPAGAALPAIPYPEGVELICAGMAPLGEDYVAVLRRGCLEDGWVDYAPNAGKAQGAASWPCYDSPPYIFTSYDDSLPAVSTLAHELGHSMHSYLTDVSQPHVYNDLYPLFMSAAETASNFNQALVRAHLLQTTANDPVFQLALIDEAMDNFHRYFFIMPTLARFEFEVYSRAEQGQPLSADILNELMAGLFAEGYGDTMIDDRERTAITWAQFSHLYTPYYTFQYAIGISAAHALAEQVIAGHDSAPDNYLNFLKAGNSLYQMDLFKLAGVDMTKPDVVKKTFGVLSDLVNRLESLSGPI